jgi:hypothetical protein
MNKFYKSCTMAAVIVIVDNSAEAGMLAPIAGAFRSVLGYDKRPTPVPTQAVEIPVRAEKVKVNLDDIVTERSDGTVGDGRTVGVRLTPAFTISGPPVLDLPEDGPDEYDNRITDPTGGVATGRNDRAGLVAIPGRPTEASAGIGLQTYVLTGRPTAVAMLKGSRPAVRNIHDDMIDGGTGIGTRDGAASRGVSAGVFASRGKNGEGIGRRDGSRTELGGHIAMRAAGPAIGPHEQGTTTDSSRDDPVGPGTRKLEDEESEGQVPEEWVWVQYAPRYENGVMAGIGCIKLKEAQSALDWKNSVIQAQDERTWIGQVGDDLVNPLSSDGGTFGSYKAGSYLVITMRRAAVHNPCEEYDGTCQRQYISEDIGFTLDLQGGRLSLTRQTADALQIPEHIDNLGILTKHFGTNWHTLTIAGSMQDQPGEPEECIMTVTIVTGPEQNERGNVAYVIIGRGVAGLIDSCGIAPRGLSWYGGITPDINPLCLDGLDDYETAEELIDKCRNLTDKPLPSRIFSPSEIFSASDILDADNAGLPGRKMSPWAIAAITGGSVFVVTAGTLIGYLCYKTRKNAGSSGGVRLTFDESP